jgi:hypothetical protein
MQSLVERLRSISDEYKSLPNRGLKKWDDKVQGLAENYHYMTLKDLGLRRITELLNIQLRDKFNAIKEWERKMIMQDKVAENVLKERDHVSGAGGIQLFVERKQLKLLQLGFSGIAYDPDDLRKKHSLMFKMT